MHVVRFMGGFANQLFQLALLRSLEEKNSNVFADLSHYDSCKDHGGFKLMQFFVLKSVKSIPKGSVEVSEQNYDNVLIEEGKDYYYIGYWQDTKYFPKDLSFLDEIFRINDLQDDNRHYYEEILNSEYPVSIHVRRGDYVSNYYHGNIANRAYYLNSIEYVCNKIDNPTFFVFSDDIKWCKENLDFKGNRTVFVEGNQTRVHLDMLLMSLCKCNIISNSSFSWWAKTLNKNQDKLVIAPQYWFNDDINLGLDVSDAIRLSNCLERREKNDNPFFSICVPAYNVGLKVRRCLASILSQTFENIEVIVVDDGSTDDTYDNIKQYADRDARISVVRNEGNRSLLVSRMVAMQHGRGQYYLFIDSDDYVEETLCEKLYSTIQKHESVDIIEFDYYREPGGIESNISKQKLDFVNSTDRIRNILSVKCNNTVWNKCYSKRVVDFLLDETQPFYCNMSEDLFFNIVFFYSCNEYEFVPCVLYHYVVGDGMSTSTAITEEGLLRNIESVERVISEIRVFLKSKNLELYAEIERARINALLFIARMCSNGNLSIRNKLGMYHMIDERCGTSLENDFAAQLDLGMKAKADFIDCGKKKIVKNAVKLIIKTCISFIAK